MGHDPCVLFEQRGAITGIKMTEKTCMFFHIPKTGGASVISSAKHILGAEHIFGFHENERQRLQARVNKLLAAKPPFRLLHAHVSPTMLPVDDRLYRVVVLRDPLERLISHFSYCSVYRKHNKELLKFFTRPEHLGRQSFGAQVLLDWVAEFRTDNFQVRLLSGNLSSPITEHNVAQAIDNLKTMDIVGVTDELEEFLHRLGVLVLGKPLPLWHENIGHQTQLEFSQGDSQKISATALAADLRLYEAARLIVAEQARRPLVVGTPVTRNGGFFAPTKAKLRLLRYTTMREIALSWIRPQLWRIRTLQERAKMWRTQSTPDRQFDTQTEVRSRS